MSEHESARGQLAIETGDPAIDRELESLRHVVDLPLGEQVEVFERVQAALQGHLVEADG